ncbi:XisI protein [Leptolyngbya sp. FACHB-541]|uniref:XisI protein n=1 Tax=Leptolyngbya sp. FACHB-541 TaxID=2692810 RepID=UPI00168620CF|nr:XisI protein [Leptolyngbya sp. FACHB-541]MBD1998093.1 XisI protein [Leptolyngbya sp. FACHB-541]
MANVEQYRQLVQTLLLEYSNIKANNEEVEAEAIFDVERDRYQVVHVGWSNKHRVYGCILHVDIKDGKIWIQHDGTEGGIANELVEQGVPKHDIVLAFHSPFKRQFTEFAVG